jgi:hypothetical protein
MQYDRVPVLGKPTAVLSVLDSQKVVNGLDVRMMRV